MIDLDLAEQSTLAGNIARGAADAVLTTHAMAAEVLLRVPGGGSLPWVTELGRHALSVFDVVEAACSRSDATSPLMRANASPDDFRAVSPVCRTAIELAHSAYEETGGLFDARVLGDLVRLGYERTVPAGVVAAGESGPRRPLGDWHLEVRGTSEVRIGPRPIELGGLTRGLALRLGSEVLDRGGVADFMLEAAGDYVCHGVPGASGSWLVSVEDPAGGDAPVAVLALSNRACATSSVRQRGWAGGSRRVHHLIDPRTGLPARNSLTAVTVVHDDPAWAQVWSKCLLLAGAGSVRLLAERRSLAALWVDADGTWQASRAMRPYICWPSQDRFTDERAGEERSFGDLLEARRLERERLERAAIAAARLGEERLA